MSEFRLLKVPTPDADLLARIGKLRVRAWTTLIPQAAAMGAWLDEFEDAAHHWVVFHGSELVAAARMSIHAALDLVPDPECFAGVFGEPPEAPIASFNRLVVDGPWRGFGLSRQLDEARLNFAMASGCRSVIGSTPAGEGRLRQVAGLGFVVVGEGNLDHRPPCCFGPRPMVYWKPLRS